jgi:thioredoxin
MKKVHLTIAFISIFLYACKSQQASGNFNLDAASFNTKLQEKKDNAVILDVRTPQEVQSGFIPQAKNINYHDADFKQKINALDKNKPYFVYCLAGGRSSDAVSYMRANGFKEVYNLSGGIRAWQREGLPIVQKNSYTPKEDKISGSEYQALIHSKPYVLIDFYAPWCVPCVKMKPYLEELDKEMGEKYAIIRINIEENKNLTDNLKVQDIPLLILYKNGKEAWKHQGFIEKADLKKVLLDK